MKIWLATQKQITLPPICTSQKIIPLKCVKNFYVPAHILSKFNCFSKRQHFHDIY